MMSSMSSFGHLLDYDAIPDEAQQNNTNMNPSKYCKTKSDIQLEIIKSEQKHYVSTYEDEVLTNILYQVKRMNTRISLKNEYIDYKKILRMFDELN